MSNVRFTNDILSRQTLFDLGNITDTLAKTQNELSTGKRIQQPEDDPYGAGRAVTLRNQLADVQQYQTNINDASAWAQTDRLGARQRHGPSPARPRAGRAGRERDAGPELARRDLVRDDADQGVAAGAGERDVQRALHLLGHGDEHPAVPVNAYSGTTLPVQRLIGPGQVVQVNKDGPSAFGAQSAGPPPTKNVFDVLDDIIGDLNTGNNSALGSSALTELDGSFTTAVNARTTVGAISNRLDTQSNLLSAQELSVQGLLSKTEDADMAKTLIQYSTTQTAYQAALQAGAKIIQPTLMDFLTT